MYIEIDVMAKTSSPPLGIYSLNDVQSDRAISLTTSVIDIIDIGIAVN